jgi:hypothetical protein
LHRTAPWSAVCRVYASQLTAYQPGGEASELLAAAIQELRLCNTPAAERKNGDGRLPDSCSNLLSLGVASSWTGSWTWKLHAHTDCIADEVVQWMPSAHARTRCHPLGKVAHVRCTAWLEIISSQRTRGNTVGDQDIDRTYSRATSLCSPALSASSCFIRSCGQRVCSSASAVQRRSRVALHA